jgi:hypothetical protein
MAKLTGNLGSRMRSSCSGRVGAAVDKVLMDFRDDEQKILNQADIISWFNECQQILAEDGYWRKTDVINVVSGTATYNLMETSTSADKIVNGSFGSDANWTKGTGWTISSTAIHATGNATALAETATTVVVGETYELTYTIATVTTAGVLTPSAGGQTLTPRVGLTTTTAVTYTELFIATTTGAVTFTADATWAGTIDNVSMVRVSVGDLIEVHGVRWQPATGGAGDTVALRYIPSWITFKEINSHLATTSPPYGYYLENAQLSLTPIPNASTAGGLEVYYSYLPPELQCTTSFTFWTPKGYDAIYPYYALIQANGFQGSPGSADGGADDGGKKVSYYEQKFEGLRSKLIASRG